MAVRALGSATIAFGLVSIPVKLYSAAESAAALRFNQIDRRDGSRVKQQLVSSQSGEIVPREEIVKGYEFARGQYVLFEAEELKALEAAATHTIDIDEFVPDGSVERIFFDKAYYLGPDKGGARAYGLLSRALTETKRIAVGRYAARGRQHLVMVRPLEGGLMLEQLHYADEIRSFGDIPIEQAEIRESELELAKLLIEQGASERFDAGRYRDEVRDRMLELIQRKVEGQDIAVEATAQPEHKIIDLMEALKASLGGKGEGRRPARAAASGSNPGDAKSVSANSDDPGEMSAHGQPATAKGRKAGRKAAAAKSAGTAKSSTAARKTTPAKSAAGAKSAIAAKNRTAGSAQKKRAG